MKYIRDDGKVRECAVNIAKMNILEYIYYSTFHWGYLQSLIYKILKHSLDLIGLALNLGLKIIKLIMFPIFIVIYAILDIRNNKKRVEKLK